MNSEAKPYKRDQSSRSRSGSPSHISFKKPKVIKDLSKEELLALAHKNVTLESSPVGPELPKPVKRGPPGILHPKLNVSGVNIKDSVNIKDRKLVKELSEAKFVEVQAPPIVSAKVAAGDEETSEIFDALLESGKGTSMAAATQSRDKRHHISSMVMDAARMEIEMKRRNAEGKEHRRLASSKYGW